MAVRDFSLEIFLGYWHQVRSYGSKNMAVSVLFSRLTEFDPTGCDNTKLDYRALSDSGMVWTYPGHGPQTMGNVDPFETKTSFTKSRTAFCFCNGHNGCRGDKNKTHHVTTNEYLSLGNQTKNGRLDADIIFVVLTDGEVMQNHEDLRRSIAEKVLEIIDVDKKGYASKEDIEALTLDQLKQMADVIDPDPANTEEYEFAIFDLDSVRLVFKEAMADGNGILTLQNLIKRYEDFGGSAKIARELFNMLQPRHDDYVTQEEMTERLDDVLKLYLKQKDEDMSGIHYEKEWTEDKEIMQQTLPSANNLDAMATTESPHNEL
ncbi:uncharacterized protein LOC114971217 [Acropora millepora]|uniref:uncharacterized protein LOC114971217 n=1 Tax=Acropora millepora TaxID=45264 RepID=UPI001CF48196|nr:uncharacterized protein LOC114971217 [Acropora millepora]